MKHLLNGVAIAAVLAITAPAWAQNPAAPMTPAAPAKPMAKPMAKKPVHMAKRHWHGHWHHAGDDAMTEQLNREELARIQGGMAPSAPPQKSKAPEMGGPRPSPH